MKGISLCCSLLIIAALAFSRTLEQPRCTPSHSSSQSVSLEDEETLSPKCNNSEALAVVHRQACRCARFPCSQNPICSFSPCLLVCLPASVSQSSLLLLLLLFQDHHCVQPGRCRHTRKGCSCSVFFALCFLFLISSLVLSLVCVHCTTAHLLTDGISCTSVGAACSMQSA